MSEAASPPETQQGATRQAPNTQSRTGPSTNQAQQHSQPPGRTRFEGATPGLKGHVFKMTGGPSQYPRMLEQLRLFAATQYVSSPEITTLFDDTIVAPTIARPGNQPTPTGPPDAQGAPTVTEFDRELFREEVKAYMKRRHELQANLRALFLVIVGQCDPVLSTFFQAQAGYINKHSNGECDWLLPQIQSVVSKFASTTYTPDALFQSLARFSSLNQQQRETDEYFCLFKEMVQTLASNHAWGPVPLQQNTSTSLVVTGDDNATRNNIWQAQLACQLILQADKKCFALLQEQLRSNFARGTNEWPVTLDAAYQLLIHFEQDPPSRAHQSTNHPAPDASNSTSNTSGSSTNNQRHSTRHGHQYHQASDTVLSPDSLLLDTLATHSLVKNLSYLQDIIRVPEDLVLHTQAGSFCASHQGLFTGLPGVSFRTWHHPDAITNILAMCNLTPHCCLTMDMDVDCAIFVHCGSNVTPLRRSREQALRIHPV